MTAAKEHEYVVENPDNAHHVMRMIITTGGKNHVLVYLKQLFVSANLAEIKDTADLKDVVVKFVWTSQRFDALKMSFDEISSILIKLPKNDDRVYGAIRGYTIS